MKRMILLGILIGILIHCKITAQNRVVLDTANGDWTLQHVVLLNTPEADMMVRTGDIDNLGFGWPTGFNPFDGLPTPAHAYPWTADSADAMGTDRIMVITSYNGHPPHGQDGYTNSTTRPANLPRPILLTYSLNGLQATSAVLQMFVDDFQAPVWQAHYFVSLNGHDAPFIADVINTLNQTGPIGKIITLSLPQQDLYLLQSDSLSIMIDDTTTGAGDGYAIDFVKLLINLKGYSYTGEINGYVTDIDTGDSIAGATVSASSVDQVTTDPTGYFHLTGVPAGITKVSISKFSYDTATALVDLHAGQVVEENFQIKKILEAEFSADPVSGNAPLTVHFTDMTSMNPTSWTWHFGDGDTATDQNPVHTYQANGLYTVSLTASNGTETNMKIKTGYIQVGPNGIENHKADYHLFLLPNPATSSTRVSYELAGNSFVTIDLNDATGRLIRTIANEYELKGKHVFQLNLDNLAAGVYFLKIRVDENNQIEKLIVIK